MVRRRARGYSLIEVVVTMSVFGLFLVVLLVLTSEMRFYEKRLPVNFMRHPQVSIVLSKLKRDVMDAHGSDPYRAEHDGYTMSPNTLILESIQGNGGVQTIVWDFSKPGEVRRRAYNVGVAEEWIARGVPPDFSSQVVIDAVGIPGRPYGVRITARDAKGRMAIDQILQPRAHE
ncbi:MAG TPA: prepilin-type N-terminal cleavage/methylation domain-containing protein [Thermoanaerobaculia bacterium]